MLYNGLFSMVLIYVFIVIKTFLIVGGVVTYAFTSLNYVYLIVVRVYQMLHFR